jgi:hypothetical protein
MNTNEALKASIQLEQLRKENRELKALVKLVDFSREELQFALDAIAEKQASALYHIHKHEEIGTEAPAHYREAYDVSQRWATQLINAKAKVIAREIVNAN